MNKCKKNIRIFIAIIVVFLVIIPAMPVNAQSILTEEEQEYVSKKQTITAASLDGTAPIHYYDKNGRAKGISIEVLEAISEMTGLKFTYRLYNTVEEVKNSGAEIMFGVLEKNQFENVLLSIPYLKTETILYIHASVKPNELDNKKYAAVEGTLLPEGIKEENTVYFKTREACLDAVNSGKADYGYANAYSVAYYTLQNSYKNIITIPEVKEARRYCIAFLNHDEVLLSIINKAISSIDDSHMSTIILNAAAHVRPRITVPMILEAYGIYIFPAVFLVIIILSVSFISNVRKKNEIKMQYERYQMLSQTSNEYLYEYHVKTKQLELSKNCTELFGDVQNLNDLKDAFETALATHETTIPIIELPVANGNKSFFKSVNSFLLDEKGKVCSVIGKLVDINKEVEARNELIKKSEIDGLTGIYNAATIKSLITNRIADGSSKSSDALILIDCDKFKDINDTYGHLQGDKSLIYISNALMRTFRPTDMIGRLGGDEFCVYMLDIPSADIVVSKCQQVRTLLSEANTNYKVTVSIGIALLENEKDYEELFAKADKALYDAKKEGRNQIRFFK